MSTKAVQGILIALLGFMICFASGYLRQPSPKDGEKASSEMGRLDGLAPEERVYSQPGFTLKEPYFSIVDNQPSPWIIEDWSYTFPFDFDHDGFVDTIHYDVDSLMYDFSPLRAFHSDGQGHFSEITRWVFPGNPKIQFVLEYFVADYNGDGLEDLFLAEMGTDFSPWPGGHNKLFFQTANGRFLNKSARLPNLQSWTNSADSADIDGDGDADIYVCNGTGIDYKSYLLINDGAGHFRKTIAGLPSYLTGDKTDGNTQYALAGHFIDVNKDGHPDLAIGWRGGGNGGGKYHPHDTILMNDGNGIFSEAPENTLPLRRNGRNWGSNVMWCRDFNGDGWTDILDLVNYQPDWGNFQFQLLLNNKNGTFSDASAHLPRNLGRQTFIEGRVSIVDFNNDGWLDIYYGAIREMDHAHPLNRIYMNRGNAVFTESFRAMVPGAPTFWGGVAGDFDNDGDPDIFGLYKEHLYILNNLRPYVTAVPLHYPVAPRPASPSNGAIVNSLKPTLAWNAVNTALDYDIQIATSAGFSNIVEKRSHRTTNSYVPRNLSWNTAYFWRTKAYNTRGASPWSRTYSFTTPLSTMPR